MLTAPPPAPPQIVDTAMVFSPKACLAFARQQWRENPIVKRVWRKIRPVVIIIALFKVLTFFGGIMTSIVGMGRMSVMTWVVVAAMWLLQLTGLLLWVFVPYYYAGWSYRKYFLEDAILRSSPIPWRDRFGGILVPLVAAILLLTVLNVFMAPVSMLFSMTSTNASGIPMASGIFSHVIAIGVTGLYSAILGVVAIAFLVTVVVRGLLLEKVSQVSTGRQIGSVVSVYAGFFALVFSWNLIRSLPMIAIMFFGVFNSGGSSMNIEGWIWSLSYLLSLLVDVLFAFCLYRICHYYWRRDVPLARRYLFDSGF